MQANVGDTLKAAKAAGVNVAIVSNYNYQMPPVSTASEMTGDQVIETMHTSGFATCANIGETLPESVSGPYVSPDRVIDASTCLLPDETWFIKDMKHVEFSDVQNQCDFYLWLMTTDTQVNLHSDPAYPQFMRYNSETGVLVPQAMLQGDVNFDGVVNLVDARLVLRHVRSFATLSAVALEAADMDGNNIVQHADAQTILNNYAGAKPQTQTTLSAIDDLLNANGADTSTDSGAGSQVQEALENAANGLRDTLGSLDLGSLLQFGSSAAAQTRQTQASETQTTQAQNEADATEPAA